ncbi:MAG: hypothetical protein LUE63_08525 [Lachnospiraceae bacterium]|nr:hypothetical protein [Lachnospiraceae bacterium]
MKKNVTKLLIAIMVTFCGVFAGRTTCVQAADTEENISTATKISFGSSYAGTISYDDDTDYYKLELSKPGTVTLKITSEIRYMLIYIYDESGEEEIYHSQTGHFSDTYEEEYVLTAGTYYFTIGIRFLLS